MCDSQCNSMLKRSEQHACRHSINVPFVAQPLQQRRNRVIADKVLEGHNMPLCRLLFLFAQPPGTPNIACSRVLAMTAVHAFRTGTNAAAWWQSDSAARTQRATARTNAPYYSSTQHRCCRAAWHHDSRQHGTPGSTATCTKFTPWWAGCAACATISSTTDRTRCVASNQQKCSCFR